MLTSGSFSKDSSLSRPRHSSMIFIYLTLLLVVLLPFVEAAIYEHFEDVPSHQFDFIIIGGGTAGNVLANRLTEEPHISVLVLEAGPSHQGVLVTQVPGFCANVTLAPGTPYNWNLTAAPQENLNGRIMRVPRGLILGGTSSGNCMAYARGSAEDYDRIASVTGDRGWSWASLQPYFRKNERFMIPPNLTDPFTEFDPRFHGFHGVTTVSLPRLHHAMDSRVFQTTAELPHEFPFNLDMNSGDPLGFGWIQATIKDGERSSSATSYLAPKYLRRPNLAVLVNARVSKVIPSSVKSFEINGVEFTQDGGDTTITLRARKEIILSAGTFGTPNILLHSGIGDPEILSSLGIPVIHNLPSVGKNLSEQPDAPLSWQVNSTDTDETAARNATLAAEEFAEWMRSRSGPLSVTNGNEIGFFRLDLSSTPYSDPSAGLKSAHYAFLFLNSGSIIRNFTNTGNFVSIVTVVVSPVSRGFVTLNSSNLLDPPVIDFQLLTQPVDRYILREAVRSARRFMSAHAWDGFVIAPALNATTDDDLDAYFARMSGTGTNSVGTSSMSHPTATYGVVNPDLCVKGVKGLRIVDASVLPFVISHAQAAVYVVAERAADLIKRESSVPDC